MRWVQIGAFVLGLGTFIAAAFYAGTSLGDILWRAGMAVMISDIVLILLWPARLARTQGG